LPLPSSEPAIVLAEKDKSAEAASPLPEISGEAAIAGSSAALGEPVREMQAGTAPGATPAMAGVDQVAQATEAVETLAAAEVGDATPARLTAPSDGLPPPGGKRPADFAIAQIAALEARDREGRTPLVLAAMTGETAQVRRLLSQGADPNNWSRSHTTALMYAAWNGDGEAVEALLDWGADPHLGNIDGRTALMAAAIQGHLGVVERLLERDVAVDARGFKGTTALMYAAAAGRRDVIARLLASGADASLRNDEGVTALDLANSRGAAMLAGPAQRVERTR